MNNNGPLKFKAQSHKGKGKLDYIISIRMISVSLERGRIQLRYGSCNILLAEALFEVLKFFKKVDSRMNIIEDLTWNIE